jgi:heme/copper-type cytochrome/quinol oxidase subunit 4
MDLSSLGKIIVALGVTLVVVGGLVWVLGKANLPLGRLPGDIRIEGEKGSCYVPLVTMIVLSVVLTVVLNVVIRLLNR